jgi:hypothetical protein
MYENIIWNPAAVENLLPILVEVTENEKQIGKINGSCFV